MATLETTRGRRENRVRTALTVPCPTILCLLHWRRLARLTFPRGNVGRAIISRSARLRILLPLSIFCATGNNLLADCLRKLNFVLGPNQLFRKSGVSQRHQTRNQTYGPKFFHESLPCKLNHNDGRYREQFEVAI